MTDAELDQRVRETADRLADLGKWVSADMRIHAEDAAHLLDRAESTLARWRGISGHPLRYVPGRRPTYFLRDVLAFAYSGYMDVAA